MLAPQQDPATAAHPMPSPQEVDTGLVCLLILVRYFGMAADGEQVYAATSDVVVIRTPTARQLDPRQGGGLTALKIADGARVADIGAGGGFFTVRLARRVGPNGVVYAQDIQQPMLEAIAGRKLVERSYAAALADGYRWHEFGDSHLLLAA